VAAAGLLDRRPAGQAIGHHVAAGGEVALGQLLDLLLAKAFDHRQAQPPRLALGPSAVPGRPLLCRRIDRAAVDGLDRRHERDLAGRPPAALAARARAAEPMASASRGHSLRDRIDGFAVDGVVDLDPACELGLFGLAPPSPPSACA
jgi:hypothetical protein